MDIWTNLYNISGWSNSISYSEDDIVSYTISGSSFFFYSSIDSNFNNTPSSMSNFWHSGYNWHPSYSSSSQLNFYVDELKFGDGYKQMAKKTLINPSLQLNLVYNNINKRKTLAISHFILQRKNRDTFIYNTPSIYDKQDMSYTAGPLKIIYNSYDNYNLNVSLTRMGETALPTPTIDLFY